MDDGNKDVGIIGSRLRLGPGFAEKDRDEVVAALAALNRHLEHWKPDQIDLRVTGSRPRLWRSACLARGMAAGPTLAARPRRRHRLEPRPHRGAEGRDPGDRRRQRSSLDWPDCEGGDTTCPGARPVRSARSRGSESDTDTAVPRQARRI